MKKVRNAFFALLTVSLTACGGVSDQKADAEGFKAMEQELKDKFGADAYYTDIDVSFDKTIGSWMTATVTKEPKSLKMGEWTLSQNDWKQTSELTLEISEGSEASDFMFKLSDISLVKLGELVEKSMKQLKAEKQIENPTLSMASIDYPENGDINEAEYWVQLKPENGGTSFNFTYKLSGELIEMKY